MANHDWNDVEKQAHGQWRDILIGLGGLTDRELSGRHGPCPACGGKDRFRFDDRIESKGDGGYVCSQCGSGAGLSLLMKATGQDFPSSVNAVGDYLNMIPVERFERNRSAAAIGSREPKYSKRDPDKAAEALERSTHMPMCELTLRHGIGPTGMLVYQTSVICPITTIDNQLVNAAAITLDECIIYAAGGLTYGACTVVGADTGKSVMLCKSWFDAWHIHAVTGCMVLACWCENNFRHVATNYREYHKGGKNLFAAVNLDVNELAAAEDARLMVLTPGKNAATFETHGTCNGVERKIYNPTELLDSMEQDK